MTETSVSSTSPSPCTYTICKCSSNVCRIRLDFNVSTILFMTYYACKISYTLSFWQTFNIGGPVAGTVVTAAANVLNGGAIGDCTTDTFSVTSPGNRGSPIICGFNTGQHSKNKNLRKRIYAKLLIFFLVFVDASDLCHVLNFNLQGTTASRSWDIKGLVCAFFRGPYIS